MEKRLSNSGAFFNFTPLNQNLNNSAMKFTYLTLTALFLFTIACSTTSKLPAWSPIGNYDYVVEDTPMGNVTGTMMITQNGEGYSVKLASPQGSMDLMDTQIVDKKLTGRFEFDGTPMDVEGNFEGDKFTGVILSGFGNFPLSATKKVGN